MPRPENLSAEGQAKAARQAKYRAKLQQLGEPEADRVDTALAQACVAFIALVNEEKLQSQKPALKSLVSGALDLLIDAGYEREASVKVLRRRMSTDVRPEIRGFMCDGNFYRRLKSVKNR
ncbi:hypothetical protein D7027_02010 [Ochrobactrum intermedium]|uniref:hypothetical protein n=1 Tax=Brucella intermedia TaxID=94625 RepID=UPI00128B069F|nr:hypothetical protein [Brucella intermedia]MPR60606.1 hypothetical protein [Brucella intermedia]